MFSYCIFYIFSCILYFFVYYRLQEGKSTPIADTVRFYFFSTQMTLSTLLKTNKELEDLAVLDLDAVLHKATQEVGEVLEASQENDLNHLIEETGDAILNILSVMYRLDPTQEIAL